MSASSKKCLAAKKAGPSKLKVPALREHRNGQAFITYRNQRYYLGLHGSENATQADADA